MFDTRDFKTDDLNPLEKAKTHEPRRYSLNSGI
jgi:hypothetical protein